MSGKVILFFVLVFMPAALWAVPKRTIASQLQKFEEGMYALENDSDERCSEGRVLWIEDTEMNSTGLQIGPLLIIPDIGAGEKEESLNTNCRHKYLSNYALNEVVYEVEDTCQLTKSFERTEIKFEEGKIVYTVYNKKYKDSSFIKSYVCALKRESREISSKKPTKAKKRSK